MLLKPASHLLFYSFVFGGTTFYSYVASPLAFKVLGKENFSALQNKVFPYFFQMQSFSPAVLALTAPFVLTSGPMAALATASVGGLANLCWLLPLTRKIKEERRAVADRLKGDELEAADEPLRKQFGKYHGMSLLCNLTNVCGMLVYGVYLCRGLITHIPK
ncbi:hypothetical protein HG537_0B01700 [Torulaspora globosa]|uniref:TMEM205-like domain-containing protein n=1 Tax=Torulaspora globosa TaxID=48254 RepID=A0A7H9HR56_9SACH|nr:hypothetical protein HG537_0B01700 [Torulaspora sp. CBS 2947]